MKTITQTIVAAVAVLISTSAFAQSNIKDSLGLPGDNFNLYGVMDVFQQSKTLEEFENKLNSHDTKLNNLDLNNDGKVDYIKVVDNVQGTSHAIVLQDAINDKETQDVAVVEVDKNKDGTISTQIVGDEQLYGKNYIVEPKEQSKITNTEGTPNPVYTGNTTIVNNTTNNYYDNDNYNDYGYYNRYSVYRPMHSWYMWDYLYAPSYVIYVSPWYWGYYPSYWNPWTPWFFHEYYGFHYHMYGYYQRSYSYAAPVANGFYGPRRTVSVYVGRSVERGVYRPTYGRRELLNRTMNDNKAVRHEREQKANNRMEKNNNPRGNEKVNPNGQQKENGRENPNNNPRNNNKIDNNKQNQRNNNQNNQRQEQPRNNNKSGERSNTGRTSQSHQSVSKPSATHSSTPRSTPRNSGGGGKRK